MGKNQSAPSAGKERVVGPWNKIEALGPAILMDPARGRATGSIASLTKDWVDQASGFTFIQETDSNRPVFTTTGSCPSQAPSMFATSSLSHRMHCSEIEAIDIFRNDNIFEVYAAWRRNSQRNTVLWQVQEITANTEVFKQFQNPGSDVQSFGYTGVSGTQTSAGTTGPDVGVDQWTICRTTGTHLRYQMQTGYEGGSVHSTGSLWPNGRLSLFSRHSLNTGLQLDGEMYAWICFDRELSLNERAIMTSSLEELMGTSY